MHFKVAFLIALFLARKGQSMTIKRLKKEYLELLQKSRKANTKNKQKNK